MNADFFCIFIGLCVKKLRALQKRGADSNKPEKGVRAAV